MRSTLEVNMQSDNISEVSIDSQEFLDIDEYKQIKEVHRAYDDYPNPNKIVAQKILP